MTLRVVIADDQREVRQGMAMLLGAEPDIEVIGQAEDGAQACAMVARWMWRGLVWADADVREPVATAAPRARRNKGRPDIGMEASFGGRRSTSATHRCSEAEAPRAGPRCRKVLEARATKKPGRA